jgi:hypothetical protein
MTKAPRETGPEGSPPPLSSARCLFTRSRPHPASAGCDLLGYYVWTARHFYSRHYAEIMEIYRRGWEGRMSGGDWSSMYYLGFAEKMPEGMVYSGPPPRKASVSVVVTQAL